MRSHSSRSNRSLRRQTQIAINDAPLRVKQNCAKLCTMNTRPSDRQTAPINARIDAQLKADIEALAAQDHNRSISNYIEMVLRMHVAAKKPKTSK